MTKSLANHLCMKQRLYSYRFLEDRGISEQLEEFNKAVDDLENINVQINDEDKAIMLLNALPKNYDHLPWCMGGRRQSPSMRFNQLYMQMSCKMDL